MIFINVGAKLICILAYHRKLVNCYFIYNCSLDILKNQSWFISSIKHFKRFTKNTIPGDLIVFWHATLSKGREAIKANDFYTSN